MLALLALLAPALLAPAAAQLSVGEPALQDSITVEVGPGSARVTHQVSGSEGPSQLNLVAGQRGALDVSAGGESLEHASLAGGDALVVFSGGADYEVSYTVEGSPRLLDGLWTWDFFYPESTAFLFPDGTDLVFVNGLPVDLGGARGINCHGCQMVLEYFEDQAPRAARVSWQERTFEVGVISNGDVGQLSFDQPSKSLGFESEAGAYTVLVIPKELLWPPYDAYLDGEKILDQENISDGERVWLTVRPESAGLVTVVGATVVPEFPAHLLPLAAGAAAAASARFIRR